jgi:hypothetical protein
MNLNDTVLLSVLEKYHHYAYLFHKELEEEVRRKNFTFNKRTTGTRRKTLRIQNGTTPHFCNQPNSTNKRKTKYHSKPLQDDRLHPVEGDFPMVDIHRRRIQSNGNRTNRCNQKAPTNRTTTANYNYRNPDDK